MSRYLTVVLGAALLVGAVSASAREFCDIAHELAQKELGEPGWKQYIVSTKKKFETWSQDNDNGDMKRYLDDKVVEWAPTVLRGNVKALKTMVCLIALYKEFQEPPLNKLSTIMMAHEKDLEDLLTDFSWDKAAARIKDRKSKFDADQKKAVAKE
jgi:hypothetical protein